MNKQRTVTITCPKCEGSGEAQLTGVLAETYLLLLAQDEPVSGHELARRSPDEISGEAMNDRLNRLEEQHGLAISWPSDGRTRLWSAVPVIV